MPIEVFLPRVDMDMTTGKVARWHVRQGDAIKKGAAFFEIETDKALMEIEAYADGVVGHILAAAGEAVPVGCVIALIYGSDEKIPPTVPDGLKARLTVAALESGKVRATPLAKRLAREAGLSLSGVAGSGPAGRILKTDVHTADAGSLHSADQYDLVPVNTMRRTIAQRLTLSTQTVPHFYLTATCDVTNLLAVRLELNARSVKKTDHNEDSRLSINDFIIKALANSLKQIPEANATWADDFIRQHRTSDVGVAVALDGGLITPIIRSAESKSLADISSEMRELAARAKLRKLLPSEYRGGTTAISNLGMHGIEEFTAIINPPHATVLAVGSAIDGFVPVDGKPVLRTLMKLTLTCDHRVIDGALGARLLGAIRMFIEKPTLLLE